MQLHTSIMTGASTQMYPLIDVDCNLIHPDLQPSAIMSGDENQGKETMSNFFHILSHPSIQRANISAIFSPSSTIEEARIFLLALHNRTTQVSTHPHIPVTTSVGIHPFHVLDLSLPTSLDEARRNICDLLKNDKYQTFIKCIGEAGLDYSEGFPNKEKQIPWWELQVSLALEFQLPLFVHERLAFQDVVHTLEKSIFLPQNHLQQESSPMGTTRVPVLIHCFTGTREECRYYISRGCFISISGFILRTGAGPDEVRACLREGIIPLDKLMIETDAPYMGFPSCRDLHFEMEGDAFQSLSSKQKKRLLKGTYPNVPSSLPKVLDCVVTLLNEKRQEVGSEPLSRESVSRQIFDTSIRFFGFDTEKIQFN